jgi:acyl-CoA reductase-like NAD-dependent aldehyde dehydrogenase
MSAEAATLEANEARAAQLLDREWGLLIDGAICPAQSGRRFAVYSPCTEDQIALVPDADVTDVERAVEAAQKAFEGWRALTATQRARLMEKLADAIVARAVDFAVLDAIDGGAPITVMESDVHGGATIVRYFAGLATEMKGETIPVSNNVHFTERQPYGVVAKIIPFNHPIQFAVRNLPAPLIAGNTVVLKPAEATPLSALLLGEVIREVLPPGVVNIVVGDGPAVPEALVAHPAIRRIGFTGSEATGRKIQAMAANHGVKNVSLELGGKNALLAFPDADPAEVAAAAVRNMNFSWSGQSCGSTSRLLVHEDIADAVIAVIQDILSRHVIGNPLDPASGQGTIVSERQYRSVLARIDAAIADGARVVAGGGRPAHLDKGFFIEPTVLVDVDPFSQMGQEEVFGPVLSVIRWTDEKQAIEIANSVRYGLTGIVFTNDIKRAHRVARQMEAGLIGINGSGAQFIGLPVGGFKSSGIGKELSLDELLSYTQVKAITVMLD